MRGRSSQRKHGTVELTEKLLKGGNNGFGSSGRQKDELEQNGGEEWNAD